MKKRVILTVAVILAAAAVWSGMYFSMKLFADRMLEDFIFETVKTHLLWNYDYNETHGWVAARVEPYGEDAVTFINSRRGYVRCTVFSNSDWNTYLLLVSYEAENGEKKFTVLESELLWVYGEEEGK